MTPAFIDSSTPLTLLEDTTLTGVVLSTTATATNGALYTGNIAGEGDIIKLATASAARVVYVPLKLQLKKTTKLNTTANTSAMLYFS